MASLIDSVIIVGCGTWGSSTALHLARRGYKKVTVLDPYDVPSAISAGNDVNKIVEQGSFSGASDNETYVAARLVKEATDAWENDPIFKPSYHNTGYIVAASQKENIEDLRVREGADKPENGFEALNTAEDFRRTMPEGVLTGDFPNWKGWFKRTGCGWVHARKALVAAATEAQRLGVSLVTGTPRGQVVSLIYEDGDVKGAKTADGVEHRADHTVLCAGAFASHLLDLKNQLRPTAWTLAHIKMMPEELKLYKNLPVMFNVQFGFFIEPDEDEGELKVCDEHPGYCNWPSTSDSNALSTPFAKHQIPLVSEQGVRQFLRECMPHLADRPFSFARICWCADTPNRAFLICQHPQYASLTIGVGGSGHGYMHIPTVGSYIADCLEGRLDPRMAQSWRWRPETAVGRDRYAVQGRSGGSYKVLNFADLQEDEWTKIAPRS